METFSIVEKINTDKLNTKIAEFVYREGYEPYIFTNGETIDTLSCPDGSIPITEPCEDLIGKYHGYKVFEDDTKSFGEIELR